MKQWNTDKVEQVKKLVLEELNDKFGNDKPDQRLAYTLKRYHESSQSKSPEDLMFCLVYSISAIVHSPYWKVSRSASCRPASMRMDGRTTRVNTPLQAPATANARATTTFH